MLEFITTHQEILKNLAIPVTAGIVGYVTNWIAIKLTFYPLEFIGIKPILGWQGIIPANAGKVAGTSVDLMVNKLLSVEDEFAKIDPAIVAEEMGPILERHTRTTIGEALDDEVPLLWRNAPATIKEEMFQQAEADTAPLISEVMADMQTNINQIFDLRQMVIDELTNRKEILNTLFQKCGTEEFKFIEKSGIYFGFLFGLVQMGIFMIWDYWWLLPLGGLLVGYATNWLALKMIFEPREPKKIGPFTFQGLFLTRQQAVSEEYAKIVSSEILTSEKIFSRIVNGPSARHLFWMIQKHIEAYIDKSAVMIQPFVKLGIGASVYQRVKDNITDKFADLLPKVVSNVFPYAEKALDMETTLREQMQALSPEDFEGVLRPAYQQDEWKLILTGALLGLAAGIGQVYLLV